MIIIGAAAGADWFSQGDVNETAESRRKNRDKADRICIDACLFELDGAWDAEPRFRQCLKGCRDDYDYSL